jgi:hypothetical protein
MNDASEAFVGPNEPSFTQEILEGVVFHRSIRSTYSVMVVASKERRIVVRVQFQDGTLATQLRSWCRRNCKLGDLLQLQGNWALSDEGGNEWHDARFVVNIWTERDASHKIIVKNSHFWKMDQCQKWQKQYQIVPPVPAEHQQAKAQRQRTEEDSVSFRHGGGIGKRKQAEHISNFLIHVMMYKLGATLPPSESWGTSAPSGSKLKEAITILNHGSGVVDAAGGAGYVSLTLCMAGVRSTVVDPRENVGRLAKKDRKVYHRAIREALQGPFCQPILPYQSLRAWFAGKPNGVDTSFRHPDQDDIQVCSRSHPLLQECSAIVALHPDEATDFIVDMAVAKRVPFVIMPCCVFSRLFPHRRRPDTSDPVCTYDDLVAYLMSKDKSIRKTILPFQGANIALWATFSDDVAT